MMDDFALFVRVAKLGSFINTARALHISHTTISRRIKNLEDTLDIKLFNNSPHYFRLTEKGQEIYNILVAEIEKQDDLLYKIKELASSKKEPEGNLTMMVPSMITTYIITPRITEFMFKFPKIGLNFTFASPKNMGLLANHADIGLTPVLPTQQTQKIKKVFSNEVVLVCTLEYAKKHGLPQSPLELNNHLVMMSHLPGGSFNDTELTFTNKETDKVVSLKINSKLASDNLLHCIQYLSLHMVITPILPVIAAKLSKEVTLIRVLPEWRLFDVTYYLLKNTSNDHANINLFSDFLVDIIHDAHIDGINWLAE